MKKLLFLLVITILFLSSCTEKKEQNQSTLNTTTYSLQLSSANSLAQLPLDCIQNEYPNKPGQTLADASEMGEPRSLHPAFYGCFDWHSSVHGHWSLVKLLKEFPKLDQRKKAVNMLKDNLSEKHIQKEISYFKRESEKSYERTYGWAWLLKLQQELNSWDTKTGTQLSENLQPLSDIIVEKYIEFLPKLVYPIRVGEHPNTAFGLTFAYDYAEAENRTELLHLIEERAKDFYLNDEECPLSWEPSGYDFLSPCLEEVDIMRRVLSEKEFLEWIDRFLPQLTEEDFALEVGKVGDRSDGKLVHLDGLNFSRAWVFFGLANQYPQQFSHLVSVANEHISYSYPNLVGDSYEGGHWLGSFAIYAMNEQPPTIEN